MSTARVTAGAISTTIVAVIPVFLLGGLAVQAGEELGFSPAGLGAAVAVYFGVSALTSVPAGVIVERYGPAVTARTAILLSAACMLAIAVAAGSYPALVALLAAGAAANGLGQLASNASLAQVPARRQGLSFGIKQAAIPASTLLAGAAVPAVGLTLGWRWAFAIAAAAAVAALVLVPPDGRSPRGRAPGRGPRAGDATPPGDRPASATASLSRPERGRPGALGRPATGGLPATGGRPGARGGLLVVGAAVALGAASAGSLGTFLVDSAVSRGLAPGAAGLTLTLGSLACAASRVGGGWLVDHWGRGAGTPPTSVPPGDPVAPVPPAVSGAGTAPSRPATGARGASDLAPVAVLLVVGAAGLALLAAPGPVALAAGVLLGFGFGWAFPGLVTVAVVQLHPQAPAAATSITQTGVYAGGCVGPLAFGATAAGYGYPAAWLGAAAAMLVAATLILLGRRLLRARHTASPAGRPA